MEMIGIRELIRERFIEYDIFIQVVLAVARLFYHLAPAVEAQKIAKPLVRLLRNHREMQYVVLKNVAVMATSRPVSNLTLYR